MDKTEFKIHVLYAKKYTKLDKRMSKDCSNVFMVFSGKKLEYYTQKKAVFEHVREIFHTIYRQFVYIIYIYTVVSVSEEQKMCNKKKKTIHSTHYMHFFISFHWHFINNITLLC